MLVNRKVRRVSRGRTGEDVAVLLKRGSARCLAVGLIRGTHVKHEESKVQGTQEQRYEKESDHGELGHGHASFLGASLIEVCSFGHTG